MAPNVTKRETSKHHVTYGGGIYYLAWNTLAKKKK